MNKLLPSILICLSFCSSHSQSFVKRLSVNLKKNQDVFQFIDSTSHSVSLFLSDKERVNILNLDNKFNLTDSLSVERPDKKFETIVGFTKQENSKQLFWSKSNEKEILRQDIDLLNKTQKINSYSFDPKTEKKVLEISENNYFYYVTIPVNSNILKFYIIDNTGSLSTQELDLSGISFFDSKYKKASLYAIFDENLLPFESRFALQKISSESPVSLTFASKKRKYYVEKGILNITFDTNFDFTQVLTINLKTLKFSEKKIKKPYIFSENTFAINSNSFLYKDYIFQLKLTSDELILSVKTLNDSLLKEYRVTKDEEINFKNSEIIQLGTDMGNETRILYKTSQYLRKVNNSNVGVSCYGNESEFWLTIGSVSELRNTNTGIYGGLFGVSGVLISYMLTNPIYDNFNSYANRKVVYINSILDQDGNHLTKSFPKNAFDKIQGYNENLGGVTSQTIFKIDDRYYFGYYISSQKNYEIKMFVD